MSETTPRDAGRPGHVAGQVKFLVCVDASPPSRVAVHYACRRAKNTHGRVARLHVVQPVDFTIPPFNGGPGLILPGDTKFFQLWYRDTAGGPIGFNLSDGLSVRFCP